MYGNIISGEGLKNECLLYNSQVDEAHFIIMSDVRLGRQALWLVLVGALARPTCQCVLCGLAFYFGKHFILFGFSFISLAGKGHLFGLLPGSKHYDLL